MSRAVCRQWQAPSAMQSTACPVRRSSKGRKAERAGAMLAGLGWAGWLGQARQGKAASGGLRTEPRSLVGVGRDGFSRDRYRSGSSNGSGSGQASVSHCSIGAEPQELAGRDGDTGTTANEARRGTARHGGETTWTNMNSSKYCSIHAWIHIGYARMPGYPSNMKQLSGISPQRVVGGPHHYQQARKQALLPLRKLADNAAGTNEDEGGGAGKKCWSCDGVRQGIPRLAATISLTSRLSSHYEIASTRDFLGLGEVAKEVILSGTADLLATAPWRDQVIQRPSVSNILTQQTLVSGHRHIAVNHPHMNNMMPGRPARPNLSLRFEHPLPRFLLQGLREMLLYDNVLPLSSNKFALTTNIAVYEQVRSSAHLQHDPLVLPRQQNPGRLRICRISRKRLAQHAPGSPFQLTKEWRTETIINASLKKTPQAVLHRSGGTIDDDHVLQRALQNNAQLLYNASLHHDRSPPAGIIHVHSKQALEGTVGLIYQALARHAWMSDKKMRSKVERLCGVQKEHWTPCAIHASALPHFQQLPAIMASRIIRTSFRTRPRMAYPLCVDFNTRSVNLKKHMSFSSYISSRCKRVKLQPPSTSPAAHVPFVLFIRLPRRMKFKITQFLFPVFFLFFPLGTYLPRSASSSFAFGFWEEMLVAGISAIFSRHIAPHVGRSASAIIASCVTEN
ncbi:uncharacterized protein MYCFIDRAFT_206894 [Pseudocercospora fijiensis CIRAD86]|uniref:Uncharacterized protein n=1 Tax=Pseudocercospora fijiensis (strain CIRAD86) TaxID=383855 RepID=M3BBS1_PSEFD|nr:uncharacterized protein MYCFIDRAFT_206894 [Pseudocercospora fijiensis CIRAD86]EME86653.1 hypothetical protein MYCFIDRAFT_206894 [Pseudocercospora fijiensis CIRAD86]